MAQQSSDKPKQTGTKKNYLAIDPDELAPVVSRMRVVLANTLYMFSLYKKYHWHVAGEDFYQYHELFDKHAGQQLALVDVLAERIRTLGGQADAMPADVDAMATVKELEGVGGRPVDMVNCLLHCHEQYLVQLRDTLDKADDADDEGSEDMLASQVLLTQEAQVWFLRSCLG